MNYTAREQAENIGKKCTEIYKCFTYSLNLYLLKIKRSSSYLKSPPIIDKSA